MQYLVKVGYAKERMERFQWLERHGYANVQNLSEDNYPYSVVIVDDGRFFGGNVTCFSASVSAGRRALSWTGWLQTIGE